MELFILRDVAELLCALDMSILQLDSTAALSLTACYNWISVTLVTPTAPSVDYTTGMAGVLKSFSYFGLFLLSPRRELLVITGVSPQLIFFFAMKNIIIIFVNSNKRNTKGGQSKVIVILNLEGMLILTWKNIYNL